MSQEAPPCVLVLVGVPGSGKSTAARPFIDAGWAWINQDTLGDRRACEAVFEAALAQGCNVVVDRCNIDPAQRSTWVRLAHEFTARRQGSRPVRLIALQLLTPVATCITRVQTRTGHPTLAPENAVAVVPRFAQDLQKVVAKEGFHDIFEVTDPSQLDGVTASLLALSQQPLSSEELRAGYAYDPSFGLQSQARRYAPGGLSGGRPDSWRSGPSGGYQGGATGYRTGGGWSSSGTPQRGGSNWNGGRGRSGGTGVSGGAAWHRGPSPQPPHLSSYAQRPGAWGDRGPDPYASVPQDLTPAGGQDVKEASYGQGTHAAVGFKRNYEQLTWQQARTFTAPDSYNTYAHGNEGHSWFTTQPQQQAYAPHQQEHQAGYAQQQDYQPAYQQPGQSQTWQQHQAGPSSRSYGLDGWHGQPAFSGEQFSMPAPANPMVMRGGYHSLHTLEQQMLSAAQDTRNGGGGGWPLSQLQPPRPHWADDGQHMQAHDSGGDMQGGSRGGQATQGPSWHASDNSNVNRQIRGADGRVRGPEQGEVGSWQPGGRRGTGPVKAKPGWEASTEGFADPLCVMKYDTLPPQPIPTELAVTVTPKAQQPAAAPAAGNEAGSSTAEASKPAAASSPEADAAAVTADSSGCDDEARHALALIRGQLPILLFDLNGTLTSHTAKRRSAGRNRMRPGTPALVRLACKFRLGIYTSSTLRTVSGVIHMLEAAAGAPLFERQLVLFRDHTQPAPAHHVQAGGEAWDTIKPLAKWFAHIHRVLLFDDDAYKACPGEEGSMVLVPGWAEEDEGCRMVEELAAAVEEELGTCGPDDDVRLKAPAISARLKAVAEARRAELEQLGQQRVGRDTDAAETTDAEGPAPDAVATGAVVAAIAADPNELPLDDI